jgi:hypothetical protein
MKLALSFSAFVLVAAISACGSDDSGGTLSPGTLSPGPSRRPGSSSSSSGGFVDPGDPDEPPDFGCPSDVPLSVADLDKEIGWKPGAPAQGSCSTTDLDQLKENFSDPTLQSYVDLGKDLSDTCRACVISKDTDATWGPIVAIAVDGGQTGFVNYGACFGAIEGDACGKAIQYESFCTNIACQECATTRQELATCITSSTSANGMCEPFAASRTKSCPSWALNVKSCGEILKAVATLCGTP